jgi:hypothetical protein
MGGLGRCNRRRRSGTKSTTDELRSLDVRRWAREGMLRPGYWGGWQWMRQGDVVASIQRRAEDDRVILTYRHRRGGGDWKDEQYPVLVKRTACNLGGARPWFICPALGCGRRVAILYAGTIFACRRCRQLAYPSTREDAGDRATRRADNIRRRLGWEPGILNGHGPKPKWMRWRTFHRLVDQHDECVSQSMEAVAVKLRLLDEQPHMVGPTGSEDKAIKQDVLSRSRSCLNKRGFAALACPVADLQQSRVPKAKPRGIYTRLHSRAGGRRSGDQFCVYVADRFVLPQLTGEDVASIASGRHQMDAMIRKYIHEHLGCRFCTLPSGREALAVEALVKAGGLRAIWPQCITECSPEVTLVASEDGPQLWERARKRVNARHAGHPDLQALQRDTVRRRLAAATVVSSLRRQGLRPALRGARPWCCNDCRCQSRRLAISAHSALGCGHAARAASESVASRSAPCSPFGLAGARFRCATCGDIGFPTIRPPVRRCADEAAGLADLYCERCVPPWSLLEVDSRSRPGVPSL